MRRILEAGKKDIAKAFLHTARFVDDLLSLDNPHFAKYIYLPEGIYPDYLILNLEQSDLNLHFLDITILQTVNRFWTTLHDKRNDPKYDKVPMLRYAHFSTHLPASTLYNTVTGQLHRYRGICQKKKDFLVLTAILVHTLIDKDYVEHKIYARIRSFMKRFIPIYHSSDIKLMINQIRKYVVLIHNKTLTHDY
jgi:hypothetical protein